MNSDKLLEDLESLVMNASKMPFSNKKMVEEEEILDRRASCRERV